MNEPFTFESGGILCNACSRSAPILVVSTTGASAQAPELVRVLNESAGLRRAGDCVRALAALKRFSTELSTGRCLVLIEEAECLRLLGSYPDAMARLDAAAALRSECEGELARLSVLDIRRLRRLALVQRSMGAYESALGTHDEIEGVVAFDPPLSGTDEYAKSLSALAELLRSMGRIPEARDAYLSAASAFAKCFPAGSSELATERGNQAEFLRATGDAQNALELYEECLSTLVGVLGPDHPEVGKRLLNLARCQLELGHRVDALASASLGHAILTRSYGDEHHHVGKAEAVLADVLGSPEWALAGLASRLLTLPRNHHHVERSFAQLSRVLRAGGEGSAEIRDRLRAVLGGDS